CLPRDHLVDHLPCPVPLLAGAEGGGDRDHDVAVAPRDGHGAAPACAAPHEHPLAAGPAQLLMVDQIIHGASLARSAGEVFSSTAVHCEPAGQNVVTGDDDGSSTVFTPGGAGCPQDGAGCPQSVPGPSLTRPVRRG